MWSPTNQTAANSTQRMRHCHGAMARRRRFVSSHMAGMIVGSVLLVALLVGMVYLSNEVVSLRSSIAGLEYQREFAEAQAAQLQAKWNQATDAEVVIERAGRELGLVQPLQPSSVLVLVDENQDQDKHWWRVFDGFSGTDQAWADQAVSVAVRESNGYE